MVVVVVVQVPKVLMVMEPQGALVLRLLLPDLR
jgi:hypothetical protein